MRKLVSNGQLYPRGYGFAYLKWHGGDIVSACYPVPLNMAARAVHSVWEWMRYGYGRRGMTLEYRLMRLEQENAELLRKLQEKR